jgi:hypothetical protein
MLWPANSPDLNVIEPTWFWMERQTIKHGVASSEKQLKNDCDEPEESVVTWQKWTRQCDSSHMTLATVIKVAPLPSPSSSSFLSSLALYSRYID